MKQNGWPTKPLGEIAVFKSGSTPSKSNSGYWGGDTPWVSAKDLKSFVISDSILKLTDSGKSVAKMAPENSLLILVRGMTLHKDIPISVAGREVAFNQDIKALIVSEGIEPNYLMYYMLSQKDKILQLVDSAGHGTGRLNTDSLKNFPILMPPMNEQKRFVEILSTAQREIDLIEQKLELLKKQKRGLMQKLFTVE
ncbi:MAG: restriction endonuclease subunit S [Chromatiales bacterium]|nr:restriction endonuclease subunit S [Chromatiales bacterium]